MRAWLWLDYCRLRLFFEFIQTQKRYPTSIENVGIQLKNYLSHQAKIFHVNWTYWELTRCKVSHICRCGFNSFYRSSCLEVLCKKGVLRNFAKFRGKHLCQSLFCKNLQAFIKKETLALLLILSFWFRVLV